jgi:hypothetical protein
MEPEDSLPHLSLSWATPNQSTPPQPVSSRSILMLYTHLRLGAPGGLFPLWRSYEHPIRFPLFSHACYMRRPPHTPRLDNSNYTWRRLQITQLLIIQFSAPLPPLHPYSVRAFSSTFCFRTPSVCVLPLMSETKLHTHSDPQAEF